MTMRKWRSTDQQDDEEQHHGERTGYDDHRRGPRGRRPAGRLAGRQAAAAGARGPPAGAPQPAAGGVGERITRRPADGDDAAGDPLRDDVGLRQLRRGARDRQRRGAAAYARDLSERIIPRGVETHEVVGIVLLLRDVLARSLFQKYHDDLTLLDHVLDAYEPAANRIANTVAVSFVDERERVIRQQQDAIRELSTPVLQVRERLLILPIIGVLDSRAGAPADRAAARRHPRPPREGRRHRHDRRPGRRRVGREPPGADGRRVTPDGCERHHHRALLEDRADAGDHRGRPQQDAHHRRPAGRHRGGRAPARLHRSSAATDTEGADARPLRCSSRSCARVTTSWRRSTLPWTTARCCASRTSLVERIGQERAAG